MELKAKIFDVEQGQNEVALNEARALEHDIGMLDRVRITANKKTVIAIVDYSESSVRHDEIGLFQEVAQELGVKAGQKVLVESTVRPPSLDFIRKKLDGSVLSDEEIAEIISDLMRQRLSNAELAAFISGVYTEGMSAEETVGLTKAIYASGNTLKPRGDMVVSEHSIGGVSGDRVSMLIVPIISSMGICFPKTCTRAISSASGTADTMEVLAPVALSFKQAQRVVDKVSACIVWGGTVGMAPADDKLIRIRNPLHLDPKPLLLSSILAKKKAEGAKFVLLDLPVGRSAKIPNQEEARTLARDFEALGKYLGMEVHCTITDGSAPLTHAIGPALEARTVLETLQGKGGGSPALAEKACLMSGIMLSMLKGVTRQEGFKMARLQLDSGKALQKFKEIIAAQGGKPEIKPEDIPVGKIKQTVRSREEGTIAHVDNKNISRVCRALGAPRDKEAGMVLHVSKGDKVESGTPLFDLYASEKHRLLHALKQLKAHRVIETGRIVLDVV